jgi:hypothetical protein
MSRIEIYSITGTTPISIYVADIYGNNETFLGTITGSTPPSSFFTPPTIFNTAPAIMLKLIDGNGCEKFKIIECRFGCAFDLIITLEDCVININISTEECNFNIIPVDESCAISPILISDESCAISPLHFSGET